MIIEIFNKWKWSKILNSFNTKHDLKGLVPSIGSNHGAYWFVAIENGEAVGAAGCERYTGNAELYRQRRLDVSWAMFSCAAIAGEGNPKRFYRTKRTKGHSPWLQYIRDKYQTFKYF